VRPFDEAALEMLERVKAMAPQDLTPEFWQEMEVLVAQAPAEVESLWKLGFVSALQRELRTFANITFEEARSLSEGIAELKTEKSYGWVIRDHGSLTELNEVKLGPGMTLEPFIRLEGTIARAFVTRQKRLNEEKAKADAEMAAIILEEHTKFVDKVRRTPILKIFAHEVGQGLRTLRIRSDHWKKARLLDLHQRDMKLAEEEKKLYTE